MVAIECLHPVAIEARRQDLERQGYRHEQPGCGQPVQDPDRLSAGRSCAAVQRQLQVLLTWAATWPAVVFPSCQLAASKPDGGGVLHRE